VTPLTYHAFSLPLFNLSCDTSVARTCCTVPVYRVVVVDRISLSIFHDLALVIRRQTQRLPQHSKSEPISRLHVSFSSILVSAADSEYNFRIILRIFHDIWLKCEVIITLFLQNTIQLCKNRSYKARYSAVRPGKWVNSAQNVLNFRHLGSVLADGIKDWRLK